MAGRTDWNDGDLSAVLRRASEAFEAKDFEQAEALFVQAIESLTPLNLPDPLFLAEFTLFQTRQNLSAATANETPNEVLAQLGRLASIMCELRPSEQLVRAFLALLAKEAARLDANPKQVLTVLWAIREKYSSQELRYQLDTLIATWLLLAEQPWEAERLLRRLMRHPVDAVQNVEIGLQLAILELSTGNIEAGEARLLELLSQAHESNAVELIAPLKLLLATAFVGAGRDAEALELSSEAYSDLSRIGSHAGAAEALLLQAFVHLSQNDPSAARLACLKVLAEIPDPVTTRQGRRAYLRLASVASEAWSFEEVVQYTNPIIEFVRSTSNYVPIDDYLYALTLEANARTDLLADDSPAEGQTYVEQLIDELTSISASGNDSGDLFNALGAATSYKLRVARLRGDSSFLLEALDLNDQFISLIKRNMDWGAAALPGAMGVKATILRELGCFETALETCNEAIGFADQIFDHPSNTWVVVASGLYAQRAILAARLGHGRAGLFSSFRALAAWATARVRWESQPHRASSVLSSKHSDLGAVLEIVLSQEPPALVEVLETIRGQALPTSPPLMGIGEEPPESLLETGPLFRQAGHGQDKWADDRRDVDFPLRNAPYISVGGFSRLASSFDADSPDVIELVDLLQGSSEVMRVWFNLRRADDIIFWSITNQHGQCTVGRLDARVLDRVIHRLELCLPNPLIVQNALEEDEVAVRRALNSSLARDPGSEQQLMSNLSEVVMPPPLSDLITRHANEIELFVGVSPTLARIPWPYLVLPNNRRLGDVATVTLVPSAAMCHLVRARRSGEGSAMGKRHVQLLVADPTSDLTWAGHLDSTLSAKISLPGIRATRDAVLAALPSREGTPGVAVFACHSSPGLPGAPATASLVLAAEDGSKEKISYLRARDFMDAARRHIWDRVLISSCSSAGSTEAQAEWLGLAAGMIWGGADVVVASAWDLLDTTETAKFDEEVVELLAESQHVAVDLQRLQMEKLRVWQESRGAAAVPPLITAAYQVASPHLSFG